MAQLTNLNVSPYYDDFDKADAFHRVLFRPGFSIQARELTTLQSILQNQIEQQGNHVFKEGSVVIPGQVSYSDAYYSLALESTFGGEDVRPSQYYNATTPVTLTGVTSGVKAQVIGYAEGSTTSQPYLYVQYVQTGTDNNTGVFSDSENIIADSVVTHTTSYAANIASGTTFSSSASGTGSAVTVEAGIYYIRGTFVRNEKQTVVLSNTSKTETARVGFLINETLVSPEADTTLTDNATGSNNYAASGAHRLKITLTLAKLDTTSVDDSLFVELIRTTSGRVTQLTRGTDYAVLGDTLARRTFDESGDYTVRPFQFSVNESIDNDYAGETNVGIYGTAGTTDDNNTADESLLSVSITPGKAYVKGYEIEKTAATFLDLNKARDFNTVNAGVTTFEMGNFAFATNLFGTPDIGNISGETTPYKEVGLFTDFTATRGSASGYQVGVSRVRAVEYFSGTIGNNDAQFKLYLFDVRMFTYLNLGNGTDADVYHCTPSPLLTATHTTGGVKITGVTSGATGLVYAGATSGGRVALTNVIGTFVSGEKLTASDSAETGAIIENGDNTDLVLTSGTFGGHNAVVTHRFDEVRSVIDDSIFTADLIMALVDEDGNMLIDGTDANATDAAEKVIEEDNSTRVTLETQRVAKLIEPEKSLSVFKFPKAPVKTLLTATNSGASDTQFVIRRQFVGTTNSSGAVTFTAGTNETFNAYAAKDYLLTIITAGDGTGVAGQVVTVASKISGTGTGSATVTEDTILGAGAKVKFIGTITRTSVQPKTKTTNLMKELKVLSSDADGAHGVRATDREISLGRADGFKLVGVFDSQSTSADATTPKLTLTNITGTFVRGEKITGSASNAIARIIETTSPMSYVLTDGFGATDFTTSDTITGTFSGATATVSALTAGSEVITSRFTFDSGMRDNFYDISRIVRKPSAASPIGRLLVVYDFFSHGAGDCFTVDSYSSVAGQMEYDDIPTYTGTKVDPDSPTPSGLFPLANSYDFRPTAENITGSSTTLSVVDQITGSSFNFENRQFDGTGAVTVDMPQPTSNLQSDFEFYLAKEATLFLTASGDFKIIEGVSAENPSPPKVIDNAMILASFSIPPYTFTPKDVLVQRFKTQRFTMRDIGRIKDRLEKVESMTALSLLERDAESFEIQDANGLNRFKSGFVVDNFAGHRVGDTINADYQIAIDPQLNEARPVCVLRNAELTELATSDTARLAVGYQKTGDLITLPYSDVTLVDQPYATRVENLQPYISAFWVGQIQLTPDSDNWFETETAPDLIINVDGNFSSVVNANRNNIGTLWNSWETQWSGVVSTQSTLSFARLGVWQRTIQTVRSDLERTGLRTEVVENIVEESQGNKVISRALVPFVRPRQITFVGQGFLPNTRVYPFFEGKDISAYVTPDSSTYTTDTTIIAGSPLICTVSGKVEGTFDIPDYKFKGQTSVPKFKTGEVEFRLTSSPTNARAGLGGVTSDPATAGSTIYAATGIIETEQETIIATRNATVVQTNVSETTSQFDTINTNRVIQRLDPLAQTFISEDENGCFLTKIDVFVAAKDDTLPMWVEIRNVINGYPGPKILPFGRKLLEPSQINVDDTIGATATTFTFDSPVYIQGGIEYCVVLRTNSLNYLVWIAQMGELDVSGSNRVVSKQPTLGVLFKSQNDKTWTAVQSQDLKFKLHKAEFTTTTGVCTLTNDNIGDSVLAEDGDTVYGRRLQQNPIRLTNSSTVAKINHGDHGMYSTSNNVTITGVNSGISTTLSAALTATGTSLTLTSATNFAASNLSSRCYVKIGTEILFGTLSGTTISSLTRSVEDGVAAAYAIGTTVELYQLFGTPLIEINKTHTAIANINIDSYTVALTTAPTVSGSSADVDSGGILTYASENYRFETLKTNIALLELPNTVISAELKKTSATSPSGAESSFIVETTSSSISLDETIDLDTTSMVCSNINEINELSSAKSFTLPLTLSTTDTSLSPVIDTARLSAILVANRINNIDSSSDVYPTSEYAAMTEPDGDGNVAVYITKKIALENPATSLRIFFAGHKTNTSEFKLLFKILRSDQSDDFDDLGYTFFNTDGSPDKTVPASLGRNDFQEYLYTAGINDDDIGEPLPEFNQFAIKIVMQSSDAANPPRIKDLRVLALAT